LIPYDSWIFRRTLINPAAEISVTELERIVKLAQLMSLDVGELDVLRDKADGRIYVCDVNTTHLVRQTTLTRRIGTGPWICIARPLCGWLKTLTANSTSI
jgi:hypothetical protein